MYDRQCVRRLCLASLRLRLTKEHLNLSFCILYTYSLDVQKHLNRDVVFVSDVSQIEENNGEIASKYTSNFFRIQRILRILPTATFPRLQTS